MSSNFVFKSNLEPFQVDLCEYFGQKKLKDKNTNIECIIMSQIKALHTTHYGGMILYILHIGLCLNMPMTSS